MSSPSGVQVGSVPVVSAQVPNEAWQRAAVQRSASPERRTWWATVALVGLGTSLPWHVLVEPAPRALALLLLLGLGVMLWWRVAPTSSRTAALLGASALAAGLAGAGPLQWPPPVLDVLFSSRGGLFFWSPVAWLGLLGLGRLYRDQPARAASLGAALLVFLLVLALRPGDAPPAPARAAALPALALLAPGMASFLQALVEAVRRRPGRILMAAGAFAIVWNLLFMQQYRVGLVPRDDTVAFPQVAENSARLVSDGIGSPVAWPANWLFAARYDLPPARYDQVGGTDLFAGTAGSALVDVGVLAQDDALLLDGWSVRRVCGAEVCRAVEGRARLIAPLGRPRALDLAVHAWGRGTLGLEVNGRPMARHVLGEGLRPLYARVPAGVWRPGVNEMALTVGPGEEAVVDRIVFSPAGS